VSQCVCVCVCVAGATGIWMRVVMMAVMGVAATAEQAVPSATGARRYGGRRALFVEQAVCVCVVVCACVCGCVQ